MFPGAHKIGAAISGQRIADKKFYGHEDFADVSDIFSFSCSGRKGESKAPGKGGGDFFCSGPKFPPSHSIAPNQGKTKGQQLKGKIVSHFFALFHTFSHFFPQDFPFKTKGFSSMRTKEKKR